jgi:hypothetical protein
MNANRPWTGHVRFDRPRHQEYLHLPVDYPRINQFPEWFTVTAERGYQVANEADGRKLRQVEGRELLAGLPMELEGGAEIRFSIWATDSADRGFGEPRLERTLR